MKQYLWTRLKARLQCIKSTPGANFNWLFLPGGPGLGSESLRTLTSTLKLPGTIWHVDLPGDGSNHANSDEIRFSHWSKALLEVVDTLPNVILVAHSTGGMYALATPKLEKKLIGLVLMGSAPNAYWQKEFMQYVLSHPLKKTQRLELLYAKKPSAILLKKITISAASYSFTEKGLQKGISLLKTLPFNYKIFEWSKKYFDPTYKAQWIPKKIPTLVFTGTHDNIIPLKFFLKSKKFQRKNIFIRAIKNAGHYPWIENPREVSYVFREYVKFLLKNRK